MVKYNNIINVNFLCGLLEVTILANYMYMYELCHIVAWKCCYCESSRQSIFCQHTNGSDRLFYLSNFLLVFFLRKDRDDYLRMYFIMDKCDPPGVFRCEALIRAHNNPRAEMPIRREFDAETTKEGKVESTCMPSSFSITFYDYCFRFLVARKIHCILH